MASRRGMSRFDLLAVLLIVGVGGGLVLAVVTRVRETATAMTCQNNLKQLSLSTHNYNDTFNLMPPLADQGESAKYGLGLPSIFAELIPFTEQTFFMFRPDQSVDFYNAPSSKVLIYMCMGRPEPIGGGMANQTWSMFVDPADTTACNLLDVPMTLPDGSTGYYAAASYAANGLGPWGKIFKPSLPNGTSNLILFSERPQVCMTSSGETVYNLWGVGFYSPHMPAFAALTPDDSYGLWSTGQVSPASLPDENAADRDSLIRVRIGRQSAEPTMPDFSTPVQRVRRGQPCDPRLPGTPHRSGLQAAMADGSVRVFSLDTSPWVFWSACTPARTTEE